MLVEMSKSQVAPLIGLDYKDKRADAMEMLVRQGNPYNLSALDDDGRVGINYGVYGVPETYVIDKAGIIRFKQIGPITKDVLEKSIYPIIAQLNKE
jgi:cytochrome c biogenesis protein CcmG/thiol:disulfide interchange protein DsbE